MVTVVVGELGPESEEPKSEDLFKKEMDRLRAVQAEYKREEAELKAKIDALRHHDAWYHEQWAIVENERREANAAFDRRIDSLKNVTEQSNQEIKDLSQKRRELSEKYQHDFDLLCVGKRIEELFEGKVGLDSEIGKAQKHFDQLLRKK